MQSRAKTDSNPVTENVIANVNDSFGNRRAHLNDDVLAAKLPDRTWKDFFGEGVRKAGLGAAMMGAGLGVSGFGGIEEKKAEAGIVISMDPNADQRARDNGFGFSVEGGGNVGSIAVTNLDTGSVVHSSLVFVNPYTAISSAHQYVSSFGINQGYSVGIGANYNSGVFYTPANVFIHPEFGGAPGAGTDLAVVTFNVPIPIQQNLTFASGLPNNGEDVWLSGFGRPGNPSAGELPQDGFIRAGTSLAIGTQPLLGDSLNYRNLLFQDFLDLPTSMRGSYGDSGGAVFSQSGDFYGLIIGGSRNVTGRGTTFLQTSLSSQSSFISDHIVTSVPEPSSLALALIAAGSGLVWSRFRKTQ